MASNGNVSLNKLLSAYQKAQPIPEQCKGALEALAGFVLSKPQIKTVTDTKLLEAALFVFNTHKLSETPPDDQVSTAVLDLELHGDLEHSLNKRKAEIIRDGAMLSGGGGSQSQSGANASSSKHQSDNTSCFVHADSTTSRMHIINGCTLVRTEGSKWQNNPPNQKSPPQTGYSGKPAPHLRAINTSPPRSPNQGTFFRSTSPGGGGKDHWGSEHQAIKINHPNTKMWTPVFYIPMRRGKDNYMRNPQHPHLSFVPRQWEDPLHPNWNQPAVPCAQNRMMHTTGTVSRNKQHGSMGTSGLGKSASEGTFTTKVNKTAPAAGGFYAADSAMVNNAMMAKTTANWASDQAPSSANAHAGGVDRHKVYSDKPESSVRGSTRGQNAAGAGGGYHHKGPKALSRGMMTRMTGKMDYSADTRNFQHGDSDYHTTSVKRLPAYLPQHHLPLKVFKKNQSEPAFASSGEASKLTTHREGTVPHPSAANSSHFLQHDQSKSSVGTTKTVQTVGTCQTLGTNKNEQAQLDLATNLVQIQYGKPNEPLPNLENILQEQSTMSSAFTTAATSAHPTEGQPGGGGGYKPTLHTHAEGGMTWMKPDPQLKPAVHAVPSADMKVAEIYPLRPDQDSLVPAQRTMMEEAKVREAVKSLGAFSPQKPMPGITQQMAKSMPNFRPAPGQGPTGLGGVMERAGQMVGGGELKVGMKEKFRAYKSMNNDAPVYSVERLASKINDDTTRFLLQQEPVFPLPKDDKKTPTPAKKDRPISGKNTNLDRPPLPGGQLMTKPAAPITIEDIGKFDGKKNQKKRTGDEIFQDSFDLKFDGSGSNVLRNLA